MDVNEWLPKADIEIRENCNQLGLVTTSKKCIFKVFFAEKQDANSCQEVKSVRAVIDIAVAALKRKKKGTLILLQVQCTMEKAPTE